ncbi:bifunctional alpha,alpha-trehalose-phosphate synthase (UDP-forming)/trehalose-phosphatase [Flavisolibacter nicotianae]|uniref:bifunctional alpha,alpha-trehalose-phosphate synthase (UDP-forming)/trehalose-phosphatase n=1 Tax=Flavisolibacter nicotianae TaxID=2364882 RepID=UPI000EAC3161|nr:bifunctional alpha,alpha-trehalose-phosphate synthase (UDP-forming)/trehalose-phosphatase [Flavisolibacter nicotianae]
MSRLLVISNRLPFSIDNTGDEAVVRQSSGGLVSAIKSYFEKADVQDEGFSEKLWIGCMDGTEEEWNTVVQRSQMPHEFTVEPLFPDKKVYDDYYNGFSNSTIWPLFHYFPSLVQFRKEHFDSYRSINQLFAERIIEIYRPGDVIWVHDYQLMLLPQLLREKLPDASIGFFLHIPFPSYELFRLIPTKWKRAILNGLLGADLVGFHTHDYVQHFIQSCKMILRVENQFTNILYKGQLIKCELFPIGIDYAKFRNAITDDLTVAVATKLEDRFYNQKILFSVDRLDYTKGLEYRLDGYEEFLNKYPFWREKVVFILNVVPSRDLIPAYIERKKMIEEKVSTINGKLSSLHWQPVIYRYNHLQFDELCALYQVADAALITPLRDGMNLVAKEYVASCIDKGVLILSELTGAANELSEALLVNPTDTEEVADAIDTALTMHLIEQRSRLSNMQRRIAEYDVQKWINDFLTNLQDIKAQQAAMKAHVIKEENIRKIHEDFLQAKKRCILLDYDGTLSPIQKLPAMATPTNDLLNMLHDLTDDSRNEVVVISGRDAETLEKWLGHLPVILVAEHGAAVRLKGEDWKEQATMSAEWKERIRPLMDLFVKRCAGSFIEEKKSTLAWHYRNTHAELGFSRSRELRNSLLQLTANTPLQIIDGNKVLEVRMIGVDKGATAMNIYKLLQPDFILCIGDDTTDEDMFRALNDKGYTIKVGKSNTAAEFTILSQSDVFPFLRKIAENSATGVTAR